MCIYSNYLKNSGRKFNIIGRSVVIHSKEDDLGCGNNKNSLITAIQDLEYLVG